MKEMEKNWRLERIWINLLKLEYRTQSQENQKAYKCHIGVLERE